MNALKIEELIKNLGQTYEDLLLKSLIPDEELIEIFPGVDELYIQPEEGVEMSFWAETERFESLYITLLKTPISTIEYRGELPAPYSLNMTQSTAHALFGEPFESSGPTKLPEPTGKTGGWESYRLDPVLYPNSKVGFRYLTSMNVNTLVFTLIDKGRE